jgi:hypothetical protein
MKERVANRLDTFEALGLASDRATQHLREKPWQADAETSEPYVQTPDQRSGNTADGAQKRETNEGAEPKIGRRDGSGHVSQLPLPLLQRTALEIELSERQLHTMQSFKGLYGRAPKPDAARAKPVSHRRRD